MLVLTRKIGQKLILNDNIEIVILETRGESVKIGIKAPKSVSIYREEIYEEIKKANQQSSKQVSSTDLDSAFNILGSKKLENIPYIDKLKSIITPSQQKPSDK